MGLAVLIGLGSIPAAEAAGANLWVADRDSLIEIDSASGEELSTIALPERPVALTLDEARETAWVVTRDGRLRAIGFDGSAQGEFPLDKPATQVKSATPANARNPRLHLAADIQDGSLWVAARDHVWHYTAGGERLFEARVSGGFITGMGFDRIARRLWLSTHSTLFIYDANGVVLNTVALDKKADPHALAVSAGDDAAWLAAGDALLRYTVDGALTQRVLLKHVDAVSADRAGGVWAVARKGLAHLARDGEALIKVDRPWSRKISCVPSRPTASVRLHGLPPHAPCCMSMPKGTFAARSSTGGGFWPWLTSLTVPHPRYKSSVPSLGTWSHRTPS